mgnify:CR=1 FL=1
MTSPRKGTETIPEVQVLVVADPRQFEMTSPRKGTETPRRLPLGNGEAFEMTSPRKGTETLFYPWKF